MKKDSFRDVERENIFVQTLFNYSHFQEVNSADRNIEFMSLIQNSKNGPNFFIKLIDCYSFCRPHNPNFSKLFMKCLFLCFPQTLEESKKFIRQTKILKYLVFQEEFQQNKELINKYSQGGRFNKQQNDLFSIILKDDEKSFDTFLKNTETDDSKTSKNVLV